MITYDTVIKYCNTCTTNWQVRITRPANYFTPGSPDTASRPALVTMPGIGEIGTDPGYLTLYGPHYWLLNGWDGSIQLGNGKHYPLLITVVQGSGNTRGNYTRALIDTLRHRYHIKANGLHLGGLSQGGWVWGQLIQYAAYAGDTYAASMITSFVNLEGVSANNNYSPGMTFPSGYGHWAKEYGGKYFGLWGTTDVQDTYDPAVNMNDSVPGSAYFAFENIGGGAHCCWNDMYSPYTNNWLTGSQVASKKGYTNMSGTYTNGSNLFQWMLRQGDTTLVGTKTSVVTPPPPPPPPVLSPEASQNIQLPVSSVVLTGKVTTASGQSISTISWAAIAGPATYTLSTPAQLTTNATNLAAGTYVFKLTVTDNYGQTASASDTVSVAAASVASSVPSGGSTRTLNVRFYAGTAPFMNSAWNNWNSSTGIAVSSGALRYSDGTASSIIAAVSTQLGTIDNGPSYAYKAQAMCPDSVLRFTCYGSGTRMLSFSGLDNTKTYALSLYGSRPRTDGQKTTFTVGGQAASVVTDFNYTNAAAFTGLHPVAGSLVITISTTTSSYLNGFSLTESTAGTTASTTENTLLSTSALQLDSAIVVNKDFHIFPNPVRDYLYIQSNQQQTLRLRLFDINGRLLKVYQGQLNGYTLGMQNYSRGSYLLLISDLSSKTVCQKIVVKE